MSLLLQNCHFVSETVVEARNDKCEAKTLSATYHETFGRYLLDNSKHFEFFSIGNSRVFAVAFRYKWCLAYNYCLILRGIPLHAVLFLPPFHISEIYIDHLFDFLWLTIGEKYLGIVSIRGLNQDEIRGERRRFQWLSGLRHSPVSRHSW